MAGGVGVVGGGGNSSQAQLEDNRSHLWSRSSTSGQLASRAELVAAGMSECSSIERSADRGRGECSPISAVLVAAFAQNAQPPIIWLRERDSVAGRPAERGG